MTWLISKLIMSAYYIMMLILTWLPIPGGKRFARWLYSTYWLIIKR